MWIADVGQTAWEEINRVPGAASGLNFGWPCREGLHVYNPEAVCPDPLTDPVLEYAHTNSNCSVTGGYVYRGAQASLGGRYLYGDYCSARIWIADEEGGAWTAEEWPGAAAILSRVSSFGQGDSCELYVTDRQAGALYRIDDGDLVFGTGFENRACR